MKLWIDQWLCYLLTGHSKSILKRIRESRMDDIATIVSCHVCKECGARLREKRR